jgi:hypothetical protein
LPVSPDDPHRALPELPIELPLCPRHRPHLKGDASTLRGEAQMLKVQLLALVVVHVRRLHPGCHFAQSALASFCESRGSDSARRADRRDCG